MQGTAQSITDQQFSDLVSNTPFQGSTCQHQDTGSGNYNCVTTTDLCTTPTNGNASGANCPNTGTNALIIVNNSYNLDPSQKARNRSRLHHGQRYGAELRSLRG